MAATPTLGYARPILGLMLPKENSSWRSSLGARGCRAAARRWGLVWVAAVAFTLLGGSTAVEAQGYAPRAEDFAGRVSNTSFFVGVTLRRGVGSRVSIEAYVCDGRGSAFRFTGTTTTGTVDLASKGGKARLHARIAANAVSGTFTLATRRHRFQARLARRFGGIWILSYSSARNLRGTTGAGARFTGHVSSNLHIVGSFTRGGHRFTVDRRLKRPNEAPHFRSFRVAVLDDGQGHGKGIGTRTISSVISCDAF